MRLPPADDSPSEVRDLFVTYLHEASKHRRMTREEERVMALRVRLHGDKDAAQKLVLSNLRLVVKMALACHNHPNLLDLVQEGNAGLIRAAGKYDPDRGTRFSTYATFWIRAYMLNYLVRSWSVVRLGTTDSEKRLFFYLNREKERLERSGITLSPEVLADTLAAGTTEIEEMERRLSRGDVSLEEPLGDDGDTLMDLLGSGEDIEEAVIERDRMESLRRRLGAFRERLNERQRLVFDTRIMAEEPLTLEETGRRINRTRERARQIEANILKKLTRNLRSGDLTPSLRGSRYSSDTMRAPP